MLGKTGLWIGGCGAGEELGVRFSNVTLSVFFSIVVCQKGIVFYQSNYYKSRHFQQVSMEGLSAAGLMPVMVHSGLMAAGILDGCNILDT